MSLNCSDIQLDCPKHTQIMGMLGWGKFVMQQLKVPRKSSPYWAMLAIDPTTSRPDMSLAADQAIGMSGRHRNDSGIVGVALEPKVMYHMDTITIIEVQTHCGTVLEIEKRSIQRG
jgi:hypothetical protein